MPSASLNVVVYLRADDVRLLLSKEIDPAAWVRTLVRNATEQIRIDATLTAGAPTVEDAGANDGSSPDAKDSGTTVVPAAEKSRPSPAANAEPSKPFDAFAACARHALHHINHGGNPCPKCGYPNG